MSETIKIINTIAKNQADVLESLKTVENICISLQELLEDLDINQCLDQEESWTFQDKLAEIKKSLKASFNLQEGTDLRVQKLINLLK